MNEIDDDLYLDALVDDDYDEDNEYFTYTTIDHTGEAESGDCVIRAISQALKKSYDEVRSDLKEMEKKLKKDFRYESVWGKYLKRNGWKNSDILFEPFPDDNGHYNLFTVGKFCGIIKHRDMFIDAFTREIPTQEELIVNCFDDIDENGRHVEGTPGHLTYIKNGVVYDDRDCYDYKMYDYWYKK